MPDSASSRPIWEKEEDETIERLVALLGTKKWAEIAAEVSSLKFGPARTGKQCRARWLNYLDPSISSAPWTESEDELLYNAQRDIGNKWADIARLLPGRTEYVPHLL